MEEKNESITYTYDEPDLYHVQGDTEDSVEIIEVLMWHKWPSYDFIFGVPHKSNPHYGVEKAFFQYRDTRKKEVKQGFYLDQIELDAIVNGFKKLQDYQSKSSQ